MKEIIYLLGFSIFINQVFCLNSPWRWECVDEKCLKTAITNDTEETALCLSACEMFCSKSGGLWPKPTGEIALGQYLAPISSNVIVNTVRTNSLLSDAAILFQNDVRDKQPVNALKSSDVNRILSVSINIAEPDIDQLNWDVDESYTLEINQNENKALTATINATTFFGSRHALETLGQLIIFDDLRSQLLIPVQVSIKDKPAYPHRGIALDTARNFISVDTIKKTINGMAASKLNVFHWHITDSQSFPFLSKSHPELSSYGAYTPNSIYTPEDIADIMQFAKIRGVKIIPEFDAPAHVGEGWQNTDFVVCFNKQPWTSYCVEPPCGQFDPTNEQLYDVLEDLYGDLLTQFNSDVFHMGGDEVHFGCWNSTQKIVDWMKNNGWGVTEQDFINLWHEFQSKALERVRKQAQKDIPIILWTSTLTQKPYVLNYLPNDTYVIQIWTQGNDEQIQYLLQNNYRLILSNYEALYLDCGFSGWVTDGNNWCSPYIGWQKVYNNSIAQIAGERKSQVLGSEAVLWTEQVDSTSVDSRLWPRAAALAENLWSDPQTGWKEAENRILLHRQRLVNKGIDADALEPQWCRQNQGQCPIDSGV